MDTSALATQLGIGMATGLTTMLVIAVLCIPISWTVNRFVYHTPFMRFIMMILAGCFSPFLFIGLVLYGWYKYLFSTDEMTYTWYFGLFPLATKLLTEERIGWAYGGSIIAWFGNLFLTAFYGDINTKNETTGETHYRELIHRIYPGPPKNASKHTFEAKDIEFVEANGRTGVAPVEKAIVTQGYVCEKLFEAARYAASIAPIPKNEPQDPTPPPPVEWKKVVSELSQRAKFMYGIPGTSPD